MKREYTISRFTVHAMRAQTLSLGLMLTLLALYALGAFLGWAEYASWHLLLVLVAILLLYNIMSRRGA